MESQSSEEMQDGDIVAIILLSIRMRNVHKFSHAAVRFPLPLCILYSCVTLIDWSSNELIH